MKPMLFARIATGAATTATLLLGACGSPQPKTPISITEFTNAFADFPTCDQSKPVCSEQRRTRYESGRVANAQLWGSGRPLAPFVMRVDSVYKSGDDWKVGGAVVWDNAAEEKSAMSSLGSLTGLMLLASGSNLLDSAVVANTIATSTYQEVGNCLTTTEEQPVPSTELTIHGLKVKVADLNGFEKGGFIQVSAPMAQFANFNDKQTAWDEASIFKVASPPEFGAVELWPREKFKGSIATAQVVNVEKPTAFCKEQAE